MTDDDKRIMDARRDLQISSLNVKIDNLSLEFKAQGAEQRDQGKKIDEVDHLLRGVDGKNGLRGEIQKIHGHLNEIDKRFRYLELRVVAITAALGAAGVYAGKVLF